MRPYWSLIRWMGHQRWFAAFGRTAMPVDRWIQRATRGRWTLIGRHGMPALVLTTTGRRTGQPRTQPLLYAPDGDGYVVIGSNWGQPNHPAWSGNLIANPDATIAVEGRTIPVRAELASGAERDRLRRLLIEVWPAYETYEQRADGRELRIFRLTRRA